MESGKGGFGIMKIDINKRDDTCIGVGDLIVTNKGVKFLIVKHEPNEKPLLLLNEDSYIYITCRSLGEVLKHIDDVFGGINRVIDSECLTLLESTSMIE